VIVAGVLRAAANNALGWDTIPSADFEAAPNGDSMVFAGRGNGHGVGLCQWGANAMAKAGKTAEEILKHYYQGVRIERRWGGEPPVAAEVTPAASRHRY
jgi:stage II sporulation protein D